MEPILGCITGVQPHSRPGRVRIYVDGRLVGVFEEAIWAASALKVGDRVSAAQWERLQQAEAEHQALQRALRLLGFRARSEAELRRWLLRRSFSESVVERVIERLRAWGYVDDLAFARQWVSQRATRRGPKALAYELRRKGVNPELVRAVVCEASDPVQTLEAALALARKRWDARLEPRVRRRRIAQLLARRGFPGEIIEAVLRKLEAHRE